MDAIPDPDPVSRPTRQRPGIGSAISLLLLFGVYMAVLWWIDQKNGTFSRLADMAVPLCLATIPVFASYLLRYSRWAWLLGKRGHHISYLRGLTSYLAGFALTATPGKAGELVRIRYFQYLGVPAPSTLAVFVFERASDLLVILLFSLLAASVYPTLGLLSALITGFAACLFGLAAWPASLSAISRYGQRLPGRFLRSLAGFAVSAAHELSRCLGMKSLLRSLLTGVIVWGLTSVVFVALCASLGLGLDPMVALGIYPLAMLIGALSFIPGGVGTTELAIVLMLGRLGVSTADALTVAVGTRLVTLWFAIAVGAIAMLLLEAGLPRK